MAVKQKNRKAEGWFVIKHTLALGHQNSNMRKKIKMDLVVFVMFGIYSMTGQQRG